MNKKYSILALIAFLTTSIASAQLQMEVEKLSGENLVLSELKGQQLTVLDFWATWCQPCVKAIPELIKIHDEYVDKGVQLIGVNTDGPRNLAKVKPFVNSMGINYPIIMDTDQDIMRAFGVQAMPTMLVLNNDGEIVFAHEGYHPGDEDMIRDEINKLLEEDE
ncbi:MAG: redoxin domain-containing protein [Bacteroidetes bacterium]|jgi:thiol-disulfide isomerase/thioredoxin|nr:redoxin domain-containing protein [Bacteroidota bacterium]